VYEEKCGLFTTFWAPLLTAKQDTVKTSDQMLDTLWEAFRLAI